LKCGKYCMVVFSVRFVVNNTILTLIIHNTTHTLPTGVESSTCAYYATRGSVGSANVVCLPYNLMLNRDMRESLGLNLEGAYREYIVPGSIVRYLEQRFLYAHLLSDMSASILYSCFVNAIWSPVTLNLLSHRQSYYLRRGPQPDRNDQFAVQRRSHRHTNRRRSACDWHVSAPIQHPAEW